MKRMICILLLGILCCGTTHAERSDNLLDSITAKDVKPYTNVTLLKVLATPERYNGTILTLTGYLHLSYEASGLYLHKDDMDYALYGNALRIDVSAEAYKELKKYSHQYVVITGYFRDTGTTLFAGQLTEIESCELRHKRDDRVAPLHISLDPKLR